MTIFLEGVKLPGFDHRVTAQGKIERKDLSGDTSSTAGGHGGGSLGFFRPRLQVTARFGRMPGRALFGIAGDQKSLLRRSLTFPDHIQSFENICGHWGIHDLLVCD